MISVVSFLLQLFPLTTHLHSFPKCVPWNHSYVFGGDVEKLRFQLKEISNVENYEKLINAEPRSDSVKILIDNGVRGCKWSDTEKIFHCRMSESILEEIINSLPFEAEIEMGTAVSGGLGCKAVKEMSRILELRETDEYEHWITLYPKVKRIYDDFINGYKRNLESNELLAIFMPLLLPVESSLTETAVSSIT